MIIAQNMPAVSSWAITGGALLSADYSALTDGRAGLQTQFRWNATPGTDTVLTANLSPSIPATFPFLLLGVVNASGVNGALFTPVITCTPTAGGWTTPVAQALTVSPQGYPVSWALLQKSGSTATAAVTITLHGGATASQQFGIGEFFVAPAFDLPLTQLDVTTTDPTALHRSSGNQPWPIARVPFRKTTAHAMPQAFNEAFGVPVVLPIDLQTLFLNLSTQNRIALCSRPRQRPTASRGTFVPDTGLLQRMTCLSRLVDPAPVLTSNASEDYWSCVITAEELL